MALVAAFRLAVQSRPMTTFQEEYEKMLPQEWQRKHLETISDWKSRIEENKMKTLKALRKAVQTQAVLAGEEPPELADLPNIIFHDDVEGFMMWRFSNLDKPAMRNILNQTKGSFKYDIICRELMEAWPDKELKEFDLARRRQRQAARAHAISPSGDAGGDSRL